MDPSSWPPVLPLLRGCVSTGDLTGRFVDGLGASAEIALARVWLLGPGDRCRDCALRQVCPDQIRCLHLAASAGTARTPGADHGRVDGPLQRVPIGFRKIGLIARSRRPLIAASLRGSESWVIDRKWVDGEGVRSFAGLPLEDGNELRGVLALFDRRVLDTVAIAGLVQAASDLGCALGVVSQVEGLAHDARALEREAALAHAGPPFPAVPTLIGDSSAFRRTLDQVGLAAATSTPVLIVGERGSGRSTVATAIHVRSGRAEGPFFRVECGAWVPDMGDRLFGISPNTRGPDAGPGLLALAVGGTLVLDDIERLPSSAQERLASWLDAQPTLSAEAGCPRLIATGGDDLPQAAADGRFFPALLDRLAVLRVDIPPLRQRDDDAGPIARHLVAAIAQGLGRKAPQLGPAAVDWIGAYGWPGNVAELRAVLDRAVRISGDSIAPDALTLPPPDVEAPPAAGLVLTRAQLRQRERDSIAAALASSGGRVSGPLGAAKLLGMKPTTLASRIKALGVALPRHRRPIKR